VVWRADPNQLETVHALQQFFTLGGDLLTECCDSELQIRCSPKTGQIEFLLLKNDERPLERICLVTNFDDRTFGEADVMTELK
jgi:hypothetical protein